MKFEKRYINPDIPAVKVFEEMDLGRRCFCERLGLPYDKLNSSNALGGGEYDFSTLQMAGAYSAFGNGGIYTKPHAIKEVIYRDGKARDMTPVRKRS